MISFLRHIVFLKHVLLFTLTAFGGPQGHLSMMLEMFVKKRKDVTSDELLEYNAFCQMLPGPSSTQTVMLIGYKRGGFLLAMITLLVWVLPATFVMIFLGILITRVEDNKFLFDILNILQAMSIGFILHAGYIFARQKINSTATALIMIFSLVLTLIIKSPWVFPGIIIASGIVANLSRKRIKPPDVKPKPIKWGNLWLFVILFIAIGVLSETARKQNWENKALWNMSENFYRFGATVFGGGQALVPMMAYQFDELPKKRRDTPIISTPDIMNGFAVVQAVPGPVFSISGYIGAVSMKESGTSYQIITGLLCCIAIFLPSTLLLLFLFPIYQRLKRHVVVQRALEGINSGIIGIIFASSIIMYLAILPQWNGWYQIIIALLTFCMLQFTKLHAPYIVLIWGFVGLIKFLIS